MFTSAQHLDQLQMIVEILPVGILSEISIGNISILVGIHDELHCDIVGWKPIVGTQRWLENSPMSFDDF